MADIENDDLDFNENLFGAEDDDLGGIDGVNVDGDKAYNPAYADDDEDQPGDFREMIKSGTRREELIADANLPRYAVAIVMDIPLVDGGPYFPMGDFNPKMRDGRGKLVNRKNMAFFPRLELYPLISHGYPQPYEGVAEVVSEEKAAEKQAEAFDFSTVKSTVAQSRRSGYITAARLADQMYERFHAEGFVILKALQGINVYDEAERLFKIVLDKAHVLKVTPQAPRERLGYTTYGPFAPEIVTYLEQVSGRRIEEAELTPADKQTCLKIRKTLLAHARIGRTYFEKILAKTEAQLESKEKKGYDPPDFIHVNAKPPLDLVAMAHLNRQPRDLKALEIAQTTGAAMAAGIGSSPAPPVAIPPDYVPEAEMNRRLAEQEEKFEGSINELRNEFLANNSASAGAGEDDADKSKPSADKTKKK